MKRLLVVLPCTERKRTSWRSLIVQEDFRQGGKHLTRLEEKLGRVAAKNLYQGRQHTRAMEGVWALRSGHGRWGRVGVDVMIVSAGYGVVSEAQLIAPYDVTFRGMATPELLEWARFLGIPNQIRAVVQEGYDFGLILLGKHYLAACALDHAVRWGGPTVFVTGTGVAKGLPTWKGTRYLPAAHRESKRFAHGMIGLSGEVGRRLLLALNRGLVTVAQVMAEPEEEIYQILEIKGLGGEIP